MRDGHLQRAALITAAVVALAVSCPVPVAASIRSAPPATTYFPRTCTAHHTTLPAIGRCASNELKGAQTNLNAALASERHFFPAVKVSDDEAKWQHLVNIECTAEANAYSGRTRSVDETSCRLSLTEVRIGEVQQIVAQMRAAATPPQPTPTAAAGPSVTNDLPVVVCPTTSADGQAALTPPTFLAVSIPSSLSGQLAVYADNRNRMALVAPKGWQCSAQFGEDGSGGVVVTPGPISPLASSASQAAEAIIGGESGACAGCTLGQACPLFANAADTFANSGSPPCIVKPSRETVEHISSTVVGFLDPPGVHGDGDPSGGPNPANGVMTYNPSPDALGSWEETCTLPTAEHATCTVALNTFVLWYGSN